MAEQSCSTDFDRVSDASPPFDVARAHRWFAVECNNLAWDLVEAAGRSDGDAARMIHAAHAAAFHWDAVGTPVNRLRAEVLLATAYERAGRAEAARHHADTALDALATAGDAATSFDRATAYAAAAAASALAGRHDEAADRLRAAHEAARSLIDADDQRVFDRLYSGVGSDTSL